jgi:asparagine synthase (glutamine-hydrolysing)
MCRIAGFWDFNYHGQYDIEGVATFMRDTMIYGGPDDAGNYCERERGLALTNRRLSIIDLSALGHQPMIGEDGRFAITYNGEVYNFQEIRKLLEQKGYIFRSTSDTEVVLKAYQQWGFEAVHKFRGMWAFAVWDKVKKELVLCRDRMGVKPLYWYYKDGLFMFASELKSFHKHPRFYKEIDEIALSLYLHYGYITAPYAIFKYTQKLEPGYFLIIGQEGRIEKRQYWNSETYFLKGLDEHSKWLKRSEDGIIEELEDLLRESFKLRLIADVPVGIFLSGGIDSSLLAALLQKESASSLKTFTLGFHETAYNEANWAKQIAHHLGTDHTELYCSHKEAFEIIAQLPELYDEPFADSSAIPTFMISKLARQKVKVVLSADGGDEQFFGYTRYWLMGNYVQKLMAQPIKSVASSLIKWLSPEKTFWLYKRLRFMLRGLHDFKNTYLMFYKIKGISEPIRQYDMINQFFSDEGLRQIHINANKDHAFKFNHFGKNDFLQAMMAFDLQTYLPDDILAKTDRATARASIEGRVPFLDHKIVEFSSQLPIRLKYRDGRSKYILRKILYKYVPRKFLERPKQGFSIPLHEWAEVGLKKLYIEYLNKDRIAREGFFNADKIDEILQDYLYTKKINSYKPWLLFVFQMWKEKWL